jgi:hypothetical protein
MLATLAAMLVLAQPAAPAGGGDWSEGAARPFVAWRAEAGTAAHLQVQAGWGQPWWRHVAAQANGWLTTEAGVATAGLKVDLLAADLTVGWRLTRHWTQEMMPAAASHGSLLRDDGSTYQAVDAALSGVIPTPGGFVTWEASVVRTLDVAEGLHLRDDALQAIIAAPWGGQVAAGWVADLQGGALRVGGRVETVFDGRAGTPLWRLGPALNWTFGPHWFVRGYLTVPVSSPDTLPLVSATGGMVLAGWRDATGR